MSHIICDKKPIALHSIVWLEGDWNYTWIYPYNQPAQLSSYNLKWYEDQLTGFLRVSKRAMVNPVYICAIERISSRPRRLRLILVSGEHIEVTRRRQAFVRQKWADWVDGNMNP